MWGGVCVCRVMHVCLYGVCVCGVGGVVCVWGGVYVELSVCGVCMLGDIRVWVVCMCWVMCVCEFWQWPPSARGDGRRRGRQGWRDLSGNVGNGGPSLGEQTLPSGPF